MVAGQHHSRSDWQLPHSVPICFTDINSKPTVNRFQGIIKTMDQVEFPRVGVVFVEEDFEFKIFLLNQFTIVFSRLR